MTKSLSVLLINKEEHPMIKNSIPCTSEKLRKIYSHIKNESPLVEKNLIKGINSDTLVNIYGFNHAFAGGCTFSINYNISKPNTPLSIKIVSGDRGKYSLKNIIEYDFDLPFKPKNIKENY